MTKLLIMDPESRITADEALEHSYFDCLRPKKPTAKSNTRTNSPIFEKHRSFSSTHKGQTSKYSSKENHNPHNTTYGKFNRGNVEYYSMIRSTSKGKNKIEEAKGYSRVYNNSYLANSTNQLMSTTQNFDHKKKVISNAHKKNTQSKNYKTSNSRNFSINTTNNFYHRGSRKVTDEGSFHEGDMNSMRNSSLKRDNSNCRSRHNNQQMKMFKINEESEYCEEFSKNFGETKF